MGYFYAESRLDFRLVEYRVGRADNARGKFAAVAGGNTTSDIAGYSGYGASKIVPRAYTFVAVMVYALGIEMTSVDDVPNDTGKVAGIGRCADLVEYDIERRFPGGKGEHGF